MRAALLLDRSTQCVLVSWETRACTPANVIVGDIQALQAFQQGDLIRQALHLIVPQLQDAKSGQVLQLLSLHRLYLVVADMQLLGKQWNNIKKPTDIGFSFTYRTVHQENWSHQEKSHQTQCQRLDYANQFTDIAKKVFNKIGHVAQKAARKGLVELAETRAVWVTTSAGTPWAFCSTRVREAHAACCVSSRAAPEMSCEPRPAGRSPDDCGCSPGASVLCNTPVFTNRAIQSKHPPKH